mmetsp:Transcript_31087/g.62362  ORF Transcript_31087/g.62362 Transcript_31087/m.62362 type:complete len:154 (+) Transcript_31087:210-671(+)
MPSLKSAAFILLCIAPSTEGFAFVPSSKSSLTCTKSISPSARKSSSTSLSMVDNTVLGAGIAVAGLVAGVGLVAFAENMGERSKARGAVSDSMATRLTGGLMEDTEVDAVGDLSSLTEKLEAALKETGGAKEEELAMSEEDKKRIAEEADDGW